MNARVDQPSLTGEEMLAEAYELVLSGWCQHAAALDACGRPIEPASAFARSWSGPGAIARVWGRSQLQYDSAIEGFQQANLALAATVGGVPQVWNDEEGRSVRDVLNALAMAVQLLVDEPEDVDPVAPFADARAEGSSRTRG